MKIIRTIQSRVDLAACAALALALPFVTPFLPPGLPVTADAEIHFHRIVSAAVNIQAGYLWPRWSPYLHHGFGYPIHNFYAPGIHILGAIIFLLTHIDPSIILKFIQFNATLLYPLGAYFFCRTFSSRAGALAAAAAYLYAPFRFNELWGQTNLSQFGAMALLPWLLWAIARGAALPNPRRATLIGLIFGAIVLIHHATALIFAPFAGVYALALSLAHLDLHAIRSTVRRNLPPLFATVGGLALGLALSAVFWLPALFELKDTQINRLQSGSLSISQNFVSPAELLSGVDLIDRTALALPSLKEGGQLQILAIVLGLVVFLPVFRTSWSLKAHVLAGAVAAVLCLFLITPESAQVWDKLPIVNLIVYPWRLLGIVMVMALPGVAAIPGLFPARWRAPIAGLAVGLFFISILPLLYAPLTFVPSPPATEASAIAYEVRTGNVGLTSGNEYLPRWAIQRPLWSSHADYNGIAWFVPVDRDSLPSNVTATALSNCSQGASCYEIEAAQPFSLVFHQMYFRGWQVKVGDETVEPEAIGASGLLTVYVPAGQSTVTVWYAGTGIQAFSDLISVGALIAAVLLIVFAPRRIALSPSLLPVQTPPALTPRWKYPTGSPLFLRLLPRTRGREKGLGDREAEAKPKPLSTFSFHDENRLAVRVILVMIAFVVLNQALILPQPTLFRRQSDPAAPPASHLVHAVFGDTLELLGYDLDSSSGTPGQSVRVTLYWRLLKPTKLSLSAAVHLTALDNRGDWGSAVSLNPGAYNTMTWPTDRYVVDTYQLHISPDAPPYVGQLRVSVFHSQDSPPGYVDLSDSNGQISVILTNFRVSGNAPADMSSLKSTNLNFGDSLALLGYRRFIDASGKSCVTLRWQTRRDNLPDYTVMLHALDAQGQMLKVLDAPPVDGLYPTSLWLNGQVIDDAHCFDLPQNATLFVGLYRRDNMLRLPITDPSGAHLPDDSVKIDN